MNKKIILILILVLCMSITFTGCQSKSNNRQNKYTNDKEFTDEEIINDALSIAEIIKNDLETGSVTIKLHGDDSNWNETEWAEKFAIYGNSSKLTEKQEDIIDNTAPLILYNQLYLKNHSSTTKEILIDAVKDFEKAVGTDTEILKILRRY